MEIWLGLSSVLLVAGGITVMVGLHRRREAHKLREVRRAALAKLEATAEHVAIAPPPKLLVRIDPEDALTDVSMPSLKKQMEQQSRSRLARGSLAGFVFEDREPVPPRAPAISRTLDHLFDDFDLEDQSEPPSIH